MALTSLEMRRQQRLALVEHEEALMRSLREVANLDPEQWPKEKLRPHTQRGLDRAMVNGLDTQPDILNFLAFRHLFGERFDEFPAVRQFFARRDLPSGQRIQRMMLELPFGIWEVVQRRAPAGPSPTGLDAQGD